MTYRALTVCINNQGSGCLYQPINPHFSYVLTARHVVEHIDPDDMNIEQEVFIDNKANRLPVNRLAGPYYHPDPEIDAAIIIVEKMDEVGFVDTRAPVEDDLTYKSCGFPGIESDRQLLSKSTFWTMNVQLSTRAELGMFEAKVVDEGNPTQEEIEGMSGGGVLIIEKEKVTLVGLNCEMARQGDLPEIKITSIEVFNDIVNAYPEELSFLNWIALEHFVDQNEIQQSGLSISDLKDFPVIKSRYEKLDLHQRDTIFARAIRQMSCPYMGLDAFTEADSQLYFGRGAEIDHFFSLLCLDDTDHILILGNSGAGKSSFIKAGLLPRLDKDQRIKTIHFRPGNDPLKGLINHIEHKIASLSDQTQRPVSVYAELESAFRNNENDEQILKKARKGLLSLLSQWRDIGSQRPLLLIMDQFEEIWTLIGVKKESEQSDAEKRKSREQKVFLALLQELYAIKYVIPVISCRTDYHWQLLEHKLSTGTVQDIKLNPLGEPELREIIKKPAELRSVHIEESVVSDIVEKSINNVGALAFIQVLMQELWMNRTGSVITGKKYEDSGGLERAIRAHAQRTYDSLPEPREEAKATAKIILTELINYDVEATNVRKPQLKSEIIQRIDSDYFEEVINHLTENRLITHRLSLEGEPVIELTHEILINEWDLYGHWREEMKDKFLNRDRLEGWIQSAKEGKKHLSKAHLLKIDEWKAGGTFPDSNKYDEDIGRARLKIRTNSILRIIYILLACALVVLAVVTGSMIIKKNKRVKAEELYDRADKSWRPQDKMQYIAEGLSYWQNEQRIKDYHTIFRDNLFSDSIHHFPGASKAAFSDRGGYIAIVRKNDANQYPIDIYKLQNDEVSLVESNAILADNAVNQVGFSEDGNYLFYGGTDRKVVVYDLIKKEKVVDKKVSRIIGNILMSPDKQNLVMSLLPKNENLYIFNIREKKITDSLKRDVWHVVRSYGFINDSVIAASWNDNILSIWNFKINTIRNLNHDYKYLLLKKQSHNKLIGLSNRSINAIEWDESRDQLKYSITTRLVLPERLAWTGTLHLSGSTELLALIKKYTAEGQFWRFGDQKMLINFTDTVSLLASTISNDNHVYTLSAGALSKWMLKSLIPVYTNGGDTRLPHIYREDRINKLISVVGGGLQLMIHKINRDQIIDTVVTKPILPHGRISHIFPLDDEFLALSSNGDITIVDELGETTKTESIPKAYLINAAAISSNYRKLVLSKKDYSNRNSILVYSLSPDINMDRATGVEYMVNDFELNSGANKIYGVCSDQFIRIFSIEDFRLIDSMDIQPSNPQLISSINEDVFCTNSEGRILEFRSEQGQLIKSIELQSIVGDMDSDRIMEYLAVGLNNGEIQIYNRRGDHIHTLYTKNRSRVDNISTTGYWVASQSADYLELWDLEEFFEDYEANRRLEL